MASGQGLVTGLGGLITLPASIPADAAAYVGWLARTASAIRLCYGFNHRTETADAELKLAMAAGAGVAGVAVKGTNLLVPQLLKRVMVTPYAERPIQATVKALAAKVGITLTHGSFAKAVPVVGGVVNGSVQGKLVYFGARRIHDHYRKLALHEPDTSDDETPRHSTATWRLDSTRCYGESNRPPHATLAPTPPSRCGTITRPTSTQTSAL
jgi:hypothetical protein